MTLCWRASGAVHHPPGCISQLLVVAAYLACHVDSPQQHLPMPQWKPKRIAANAKCQQRHCSSSSSSHPTRNQGRDSHPSNVDASYAPPSATAARTNIPRALSQGFTGGVSQGGLLSSTHPTPSGLQVCSARCATPPRVSSLTNCHLSGVPPAP